MATIQLTKILGLATFLMVTSPAPLYAQQSAGQMEGNSNYIAINGWDLRILNVNSGGIGAPSCFLSTTVLAQPDEGARGGRVTIQVGDFSNDLAVTATITGGVETDQPIELWVDKHLIADQRSNTGSVSFKNKPAQSLVTLFKAGRLGSVRFRRKGQSIDVPISLKGFTRAIHTVRQEC